MKYQLKATIYDLDPETFKSITKHFNFTFAFCYRPNDYGNGYFVSIKNIDTGIQSYYDIRYDKIFDYTKPTLWIMNWLKTNVKWECTEWTISDVTIDSIGVKKSIVRIDVEGTRDYTLSVDYNESNYYEPDLWRIAYEWEQQDNDGTRYVVE